MANGDTCAREYLSLREIQLEELALLRSFKQFCDEHDLTFYLAGGTLLGAVRHKGFIPWDDDVDVCMPRPDWDRFVRLASQFKKATGNSVEPFMGANLGNTPFVKVCSSEIAVRAEIECEDSALWLDVFPVDGLPDSEEGVESVYNRAHHLRSFVTIATTTVQPGHSFAQKAARRVLGPILRIPSVRSFSYQRLDAFARSLAYGSTNTVGALTWGVYGAGEAMPLDEFEKQVSVEFEGCKMPCMSCWEKYLTGLYGDYMQLPPVEKRAAHGMKAWRIGGATK